MTETTRNPLSIDWIVFTNWNPIAVSIDDGDLIYKLYGKPYVDPLGERVLTVTKVSDHNHYSFRVEEIDGIIKPFGASIADKCFQAARTQIIGMSYDYDQIAEPYIEHIEDVCRRDMCIADDVQVTVRIKGLDPMDLKRDLEKRMAETSSAMGMRR